jgi:hypothetical protein
MTVRRLRSELTHLGSKLLKQVAGIWYSPLASFEQSTHEEALVVMCLPGTIAFGTVEGWLGVMRLSGTSFVDARVIKLSPGTEGGRSMRPRQTTQIIYISGAIAQATPTPTEPHQATAVVAALH